MNSYYKLGFCLSPKLDKFLAACAVSHFESNRSSMTSHTWGHTGHGLTMEALSRQQRPGGGHALGTRMDLVTMGERV